MPKKTRPTAPVLPGIEPDIDALQHTRPTRHSSPPRRRRACDVGLFDNTAGHPDLVDLMKKPHKPSAAPPLPMRPATDAVDWSPFQCSPAEWEDRGHQIKTTDPTRAARYYRLAAAIRNRLAIRDGRLH
jgi:hypothetical protein